MTESKLHRICLWKILGQDGRIEHRKDGDTLLPNEKEENCINCVGYGVYLHEDGETADFCQEYLATKLFKRDYQEVEWKE